MARCGFAVQKILPQNATQGRITPRKFILHTAVDAPGRTSLYNWFASPGAKGAESTFYVMRDGTIEQYMDTAVRADAQWAGNVDAISCETEDDGNPSIPWTDAQLQSIIRLILWCIDVHPGIAPVQCPTPTGSGIGWHELFREWNQSAHTCPGAVREQQIRTVILPALDSPKPAPSAPLNPGGPMAALVQHNVDHRFERLRITDGVSAGQSPGGVLQTRWQSTAGSAFGPYTALNTPGQTWVPDSLAVTKGDDGNIVVTMQDAGTAGVDYQMYFEESNVAPRVRGWHGPAAL